jgi:outer membrane protein assembly factor BamD
MLLRLSFLLLILSLFSGLSGCSSTPEDDDTVDMTPEEIYAEAKSRLDENEYASAIRYYEVLQSRYPYCTYSEQAQLDIIYAYYKFDEPESAILAAERFIKLHPNHQRVEYAYYMRALASDSADPNIIYRIFNQDPSERDPKAARRAFGFYKVLIRKFPDSRYAEESITSMHRIRDSLAQYQFWVTDFYIQRKAYVAAANRAKYIIENFQGTPIVPDAMAAMITAYLKLNLDDLAQDTLKVLELNYPEHDATQSAKEMIEDLKSG